MSNINRSALTSTSIVVLAFGAGSAVAQRAETTATGEASDAFGFSVAGETIGLYSDKYVRGFSPVSAGNLRLDGLYIDRQGELVERVFSDVSIRVGITALDTALPAPSGVADYALRRPGDLTIGSVATGWYSFESPFLEVDWAGREDAGLTLAAGASVMPDDNVKGGGDGRYGTAFLSPTWTAGSGTRLTGFLSGSRYEDYESEIAYYTAGPFAPPEVRRGHYLGQDWAGDTGNESNHGVIVDRAVLAGWALKAGVFRSEWAPEREVFQYVDAIAPDGDGVFGAILFPERRYLSWSGEMQGTRGFSIAQDWRASLLLNVRVRDATFDSADGSEPVEGPVRVGEPAPALPQPAVPTDPDDRETVRQVMPGASLRLEWRNRLALQLGVQRADYSRRFTDGVTGVTTTNSERPWVGSASTSLALGHGRLAYVAYTRGFEDSGYAPTNAANPGQILPASITEQWDTGLRWPLPGDTSLIASVFRLERPGTGFDENGEFGLRGLVRNEGAELSVVSRPVEGLSVVLGALVQRARLHDAPEGVGPRAVGIAEYSGILELDYEPPHWNGFAASASVSSTGPVIAKEDNTVQLPSFTTLDLGLRYAFELGRSPASLRLSTSNVTDTFSWIASDDESFRANEQRAWQLVFAADF